MFSFFSGNGSALVIPQEVEIPLDFLLILVLDLGFSPPLLLLLVQDFKFY